MLRVIFVLFITFFGVLISFKDAFFGLMLYTWYAYFSPLELTYGMLADTKLSFLVAVVLILTTLFQHRKLFVLSNINYTVLLFCFVAFFGLALHGTYSFEDIISETGNLNTLAFIAVFTPVLLNTEDRLRKYIMVIAISVGLLAAYYGVFGLASGSTFISGTGRIGDNNYYGLLLVSVIPLLPFCIKHSYNLFLKILFILILIGMTSALMLTFSRGAFLAFTVVVLLWLMSWNKKILIPVILFGVLGYYSLTELHLVKDFNEYDFERDFRSTSSSEETFDRYILRIGTLFDGIEKDESGQSRVHFWKVAILMANDRPLFGTGLNRFALDYKSYDYLDGKYGTGRAVHSTPMLIAAEMGYLGLGSYILIVLSCLYYFYKTKLYQKKISSKKSILSDAATAAIISLAGFCVAGLFVIGVFLEIFWSLVSIAIACDVLTRKQINEMSDNNK